MVCNNKYMRNIQDNEKINIYEQINNNQNEILKCLYLSTTDAEHYDQQPIKPRGHKKVKKDKKS